jgi:Trk K+ transport system NAD-binding subunit
VVAAPINRAAQAVYLRFEDRLQRFEPPRIHRDELPTDLGNARVLILGMGRTGTAAYDHLIASCDRIVAIDSDSYKVEGHRKAGRNALFADVEDAGFWRGLDISRLEAVILAMDSVEAKEAAARALRRNGFSGPIVSHALFEEHIDRLLSAGATHTYLTMNQAGMGLADHAVRAMDSAGRVQQQAQS